MKTLLLMGWLVGTVVPESVLEFHGLPLRVPVPFVSWLMKSVWSFRASSKTPKLSRIGQLRLRSREVDAALSFTSNGYYCTINNDSIMAEGAFSSEFIISRFP